MKKVIYFTLLIFITVACERNPDTPTPTLPMSPEASAYLEAALDIIQENSYYSSQVDWEEIRPRVYSYVPEAQFPDETYRAIESAINALHDRHAGLLEPGLVVDIFQNSTIDQGFIPDGRIVADRLGYISVPGVLSSETADLVEFATKLQQITQTLDENDPCGWIVDLQKNGGGNMWPMLAGLGPLLGEGMIGAFVDKDGTVLDWSYENGGSLLDGNVVIEVEEPYTFQQEMPLVTVLTSAQTMSSGEAIAVAFRGRPDTRSFGQTTAGFASAVQWFPLSDGAWLGFTTAMYADRTGQVYGLAITPDEITSPGEEIPQAAIDWLLSQPACSTP